jgi:hypothetical protein
LRRRFGWMWCGFTTLPSLMAVCITNDTVSGNFRRRRQSLGLKSRHPCKRPHKAYDLSTPCVSRVAMDVSRHLSSYPVQNSPSARVRIVRTYMYNTPTSTNGSMVTALSCLCLAAVPLALRMRAASHHSEVWRCRLSCPGASHVL